MPDTLTCPICGRPGVPTSNASCPQCDADLTCFQALESLSEKKFSLPLPRPVKEVKRKSSFNNSRLVLFLCLLLVFVGGCFCFYALRAHHHVDELEQQVVVLQTNLQVAEQEVEHAKKIVCIFPESEKISVAEEDSFEEDDPLIYIEDVQLAQATLDTTKDRKEKQGTQNSQDVQPVQSAQDTKHVQHVAQKEHPENTEDISSAKFEVSANVSLTVSPAVGQEGEKKEVVIVASVVRKAQATDIAPGKASISTITGVTTATGQKQSKEGQAKEPTEQKIEKKAGGQASTDEENLPVIVPVIELVSKKKNPPHIPAVRETVQVEQTVEELLPLLSEKRWSKKTFLYLAKKTDTLWGLAKRFYGDGKYYPVIMELNPDLAFSHIEDDKSVRFFSDRAVLKDMYNHRIECRQGMMLWKHKVLAGETRQIIERRFTSPRSFGQVLYDKNPLMYPGALVRVILQ